RIRLELAGDIFARVRHEHLGLHRLAQLCGVSVSTVARELRRYGLDKVPRAHPGRKPAWHYQAVRQYRSGLSIAEVARALGQSPGRIRTVLLGRGIAVRPRGGLWAGRMRHADRQRLAAFLCNARLRVGLTQGDLAERSRVTQVTISALENARQAPT